jgi:hypothetical protein
MNIGKWFVMLVAMLALTGLVMAETNTTDDINDNATQGQALNVRYDHLTCKVEFTNTQIDLLKEYASIDQTANKDKLTADLEVLETYLDSNNREAFDNFTTSTFRIDMQKATQDLNTVKKNFRQYNVTNESKTALLSELKDAKSDYSACVSDKELKMATVMQKHMDKWSEHWGNVINRMEERNITMADAEALQTEIAAKNAELSALIASGNITKIQEFMKAYHEDQLHYAARFEIARLKGYRGKLEPMADKYNMSDRLHDIDDKIAEAEKLAQPGNRYAYGEFKNTWDDIKDAGRDMQNVAKEINSERIKERQEKMNERQEKIAERQEKIAERIEKRNGSGEPRGPGTRGQDLNNGVDTNESEE